MSHKKATSKEAIQSLLKYSETHGNILEKYNTQYFLQYFDQSTIEELEEYLGQKKYGEVAFIMKLTNFILHAKDQTLFLVIGVIDFYQRIREENHMRGREISVKDFTNMLCKDISKKRSEIELNTREIVKCKHGRERPKDIDINPPTVYNYPEKESPEISKSVKKIERRVDSDKQLESFHINRKMNEIITLGRLSSQINIFSMELNRINRINPKCFLLYRNAAIISLAFSEKQQRVGCIITHAGLAFWDYQDQFNTEKIIQKCVGDKVCFLDAMGEWITTTHNSISVWDLKMERVKVCREESAAVTMHHLQEIRHLRCLAVSYTMKDQHKWIMVYRNDDLKLGSKMKLGLSGIQKMHYHENSQTILLTGSNKVSVLQIDSLSLDLSHLTELVGHQTTVTAITDLQDSLVATGDDKGTVRIWDLTKMRCQQVLKVGNSLTLLQYYQGNLIYGDSRLNLIQLQQIRQKIPLRQQYGIAIHFKLTLEVHELHLFTNAACRIYDSRTGKPLQIIELCSSQEQIVLVEKQNNSYILYTSKGYLYKYSSEWRCEWRMSTASNAYLKEELTHIRADGKNNLFATVTRDGNLYVWSEDVRWNRGKPVKSLDNSNIDCCYQISLVQISAKFGLIMTTDMTPMVKIWDYETCKLLMIVRMEVRACVIRFGEQYPLIAIGCPNDRIYLYKFSRKDGFQMQFCGYSNLLFPESKLNSLLSVDSTLQLILMANTDKPRTQTRFTESKTISNGIIFYAGSKCDIMLVNYGRGYVIALNITQLCESIPKSMRNYKTSNIHRTAQEFIITQFCNVSHKSLQPPDPSLNDYDKLPAKWNKDIHSDVIIEMSLVQQYVTTMCLNGELKITSIEHGELVGCININNPVPSLWRLELSEEEILCQKVYYALTRISSIINDKDIGKEEKEVFRIGWFMKQICCKPNASALKKKRVSAQGKRDEGLRPSSKENRNSQSLKSMEAFRRVSLIRNRDHDRASVDLDFTQQRKYLGSMREKQDMIKVLAPHYPPAFISNQDNQKYGHIFTKSVQVSPVHSPEKGKGSKLQLDSIQSRRKLPSKYHARSVSQSVKSIYPRLNQLQGEDMQERVEVKLRGKEPIREISEFIKHLNRKIPKEKTFKKHLKKNSKVFPKFA